MEYKDYYKILGVSRDAKEDEIKKSYRKLARKYHPDVSKESNAEERFKEVQEAYEVLKDSKKRAAYDQLGSNWKSGQEFRPPPGWQGFGGFDFEETDMGGFSDFFASIFGGGGRRGGFHQRVVKRRGEDQQAQITLSLEEAFKGGEKTIQLQVPEADPHGRIHYQTHALKISIPAGITAGKKLRLAQQGTPGMGGGPAGDLYLEIQIAPHRLYTVEEKNVFLMLPITPWEAALGAKISVPTLGGVVDMKIAPGSQSGQKLRLKGRGLPGKPQAGDQFVELQIKTPPAETESQKNLYKKLSEEMPFNPRSHIL